MKIILSFFFVLFASLASAACPTSPITNSRCVATTGNDANDCLALASACRTAQRGINSLAAPDNMTGGGAVYFADGNYAGGAHILYYRFVQIVGNIAEPWKVKFTQENGVAFWVEDHAIGGFTGFECDTPGGVCIATRQHAIADFSNIRFARAGQHLSAGEISKINCGGAYWIMSGATNHAVADDHSSLQLGCPIWINGGQTFNAFVSVSGSSLASLKGATFSGPGTGTNTTGKQGATGNWGDVIRAWAVTIPGNAGFDTTNGGQVQ